MTWLTLTLAHNSHHYTWHQINTLLDRCVNNLAMASSCTAKHQIKLNSQRASSGMRDFLDGIWAHVVTGISYKHVNASKCRTCIISIADVWTSAAARHVDVRRLMRERGVKVWWLKSSRSPALYEKHLYVGAGVNRSCVLVFSWYVSD